MVSLTINSNHIILLTINSNHIILLVKHCTKIPAGLLLVSA